MNAIKESFDKLPTAICIFSSKGLVRLMNRRMLAVGSWLLGSGIQTLGELQAVLKNPPETVTKDAAMPGVYHFPDGSALRFSENAITDRDGQRYTEVITADVSELMAVRTRLDAENARLDAANEALRKLGEEMADIVREEEILNMKIRVHDDIGYSLCSLCAVPTGSARIWSSCIHLPNSGARPSNFCTPMCRMRPSTRWHTQSCGQRNLARQSS